MTTSFRPSLAPVQPPGCRARLNTRYQLEMLRWRLPMPFTMPDLSRCIASRGGRAERHAAVLAEATIRDWIRKGYITGAGTVAGLPAYKRGES
ncbi:hypothetical protein [Halomonas caseinilytica]|uniref:hypothetical protein n=1 Tax=Halomonas caseinilytica TaxID=438744 RepID=UPI000848F62A|nr:hypothetical protein [Halomonas caseinilytica]